MHRNSLSPSVLQGSNCLLVKSGRRPPPTSPLFISIANTKKSAASTHYMYQVLLLYLQQYIAKNVEQVSMARFLGQLD